MGVLADWQIKREIKIEPFEESSLRPGVISYGVSSYGYDVRVGRKFKVFTNVYGAIVDPKNFTATAFVDIEGDYCLIPPNSFALAETVEHLEIPRDILCVAIGKSTYACCGIIVGERNATRTRVARQNHHRDLQHYALARQDLRRRGHRPDSLPARRKGMPDELRRQTRQVPGPEGTHAPLRAGAGAAIGREMSGAQPNSHSGDSNLTWK